ncbi:very short patch repair endonuclease [Streptomyces sp. CBMA152]|uniref:very short patch repair endonuclease n=1 Tax=Streptomyces sp. CBMA152 TaxID=1896312 RepID=UPI001CB72801|nr:very short patch repair endonuclease [Streptomyces sp. CBMA152]
MTDNTHREIPPVSWASTPGTRRSMQSNKGRDTKPELALRHAVHALGLRYRVAYRPIPSVRRTADLVFTKARLAVFLDGCFWHGCPSHHTVSKTNADYWSAKVETNRKRDRQTDRLLEEAGWTVLRIWEHEDPTAAAARVRDLYRGRLKATADE